MRNISTIGDKLSHGGVVVTGSKTRRVNGRFVARLGDKCICDHHGSTVIAVVSARMPFTDGRPTAHAGAKTACGAVILPSMHKNYQGIK